MIMVERINVSKRYFDANKVRLRPYALVTLADGSTHFNSNKVRLRPLERKVEKDNVIQEV